MGQPFQRTLSVHSASALSVTEGANFGDMLSFADELNLDDTYQLSGLVAPQRLCIEPDKNGTHFRITPDSGLGKAGNLIVLDSVLTFISPEGIDINVILLVEVHADHAANVYFLPMAGMKVSCDYRLAGIDKEGVAEKFAQLACVSFSRGTRITLASGEMRRVEELEIGDLVLTRNSGMQPIRWIGQQIVRAVGEFAPVLIKKGVLNNQNDLRVSPDHRLFIYQRRTKPGRRPEMLVKARYLVDQERVLRLEGGFVEYFQLLFDDHHIIYAEGIAAESLQVDTRNLAALPQEIRAKGDSTWQSHSHAHHSAFELHEDDPSLREIINGIKGN